MRTVARGIGVSALAVMLYTTAAYAQQAQGADYESFKEFFSESSWETASYGLKDHAGYEYYGYLFVPQGGYRSWDINLDSYPNALAKHPDFTDERLYLARTGGVYRGEWYSPDEIGRIFRENGIFYGNMGNSDVESIWIQKKYGLRQFQGIPGHVKDLGFTGFSEKDFARYRDNLRVIMRRLKGELQQKENVYEISIIDDPQTIWMLTGSGIMHLFLDSLEANYENINRTFRAELGFDFPLTANPSTPLEKAQHSTALQWVRSKMHSIMALQMEVFREEINPAGLITSNIHGEDVIDYETHGTIVDHPGPSARAQFSDREMVLRYWNGYIFRLWRDLTDQPLFASSRINDGVITARTIPTANAVKYWHSQALQNGTVGFYQWLRDYGPRNTNGSAPTFSGPAFANPDSSTLPQQRWNAVLDISRELSHTKVFDPPTAKTGILVSFNTVNIDGWKRVFSSYVELVKAGVWNGFVSDQEILNGTEDLSQWSVLYLPAMEYTDTRVVDALREFVQNGGVLISVDPKVFSYDMRGNDISHFRKELFGVQPQIQSAGPQSVRLNPPYTSQRIYSQEETFRFTPADGSQIIGVYPDGSPAVVSRTMGKGRAIYWGAPLASIYLTNPYGDPELDGRGAFYTRIEQENQIPDYSWIWDITVDNLKTVTGEGQPSLPPIRSDIPLD